MAEKKRKEGETRAPWVWALMQAGDKTAQGQVGGMWHTQGRPGHGGQRCRGGQRGVFWALWAVMASFPLTGRLWSPQKRLGCRKWLTPKQQKGEWQQGPETQLMELARFQGRSRRRFKHQLQGTGGKGPG